MKLTILLVLASAGVLTAVKPTCRNEYTFHEDFCYKLYTTAMTFYEASEYCVEQDGTELASILSLSEARFIRSTYRSYGGSRTWIGGVKQRDQWVWVDTNTLMTWTNWWPGQPNNNSGDSCAALKSCWIRWADESCTNRYQFICKRPYEETTPE